MVWQKLSNKCFKIWLLVKPVQQNVLSQQNFEISQLQLTATQFSKDNNYDEEELLSELKIRLLTKLYNSMLQSSKNPYMLQWDAMENKSQ
jgi:hypothetical protein